MENQKDRHCFSEFRLGATRLAVFTSPAHPALRRLSPRVFSSWLFGNPSGSFHLACSPTERKKNFGFTSSWNWSQGKLRGPSESFLLLTFASWLSKQQYCPLETMVLLNWTLPVAVGKSSSSAPSSWASCDRLPQTSLVLLASSLLTSTPVQGLHLSNHTSQPHLSNPGVSRSFLCVWGGWWLRGI